MSNNLPAKTNNAIPGKISVKDKRLQLEKIQKDREEAKSQMTKGMLAALPKFEKQYDGWVENSFRSRWEIGKSLKEFRDDEETYGRNAISLLASYKQVDRSMLDKSIHFFTDFNAKLLDKLARGRMKQSQTSASWQHVEVLMTVEDAKTREELLDQMFENNWSVEELYYHAAKSSGQAKKVKHAGGRPVNRLPTYNHRLENFSKIANVVIRNESEIWRHAEAGFLAALKTVPADKLTEDFVGKIDENVVLAERAIATLAAVKAELEQAATAARKRMEDQAAATAAAQEADEPEGKETEEPVEAA